jgi:rod shape determining protein RodA
MLDSRLRKNLDIPLLVLTVAVVTLGIVTLYSLTRDNPARFYQKQILWFLLGLAGLAGAATVDYARLPRFTRILYVTNLALLVFVLKFAPEVKGATRWIPIGSFQFQPSEFAKIILIVCLAVYLNRRHESLHRLPVLIGSFMYLAIPALLIFKQPDLGTSLVLMAIWFGMTYMAGARWWHLALFVLSGALLFAGLWHFDRRHAILKDYQRNRLIAFVNPEVDPKDAGYHVIQARIAVGSGQLWGKGLGRGTQSHGKFIPENHTDFIFTVVGEEGGFFETVLLILLYGCILLRGLLIMAGAEDLLGRLLAAGVVSMYAFHIIVNIGMTVGIMPVTGVPLPLFSYGGSNLMLNMTAIGLLLGIGMRRHRLVF